MLKLTKTGIGLLTRQYRSVLKKCWAINVGVFALGAVVATVPNEAEAKTAAEMANDLMAYLKASNGAGIEWTGTPVENGSERYDTSTGQGVITIPVIGSDKTQDYYFTYKYTTQSDVTVHTSRITTSENQDLTHDYFFNIRGFSSSGGAVSNSYSTKGSISGVYNGNYAEGSNAYGGAVYNYGTITDLKGVYNGNYVRSTTSDSSSNVYGGAIYNNNTIGSISGTYNGNSAYSDYSNGGGAYGGAISNSSGNTIGSISGTYNGNYAYATLGSAHGGAISNSYKIGSISGTYNGNYAKGKNRAWGGAIYNKSVIRDTEQGTGGIVNASFIGNYAQKTGTGMGYSAHGGAIYTERDLWISADNGRSIISGNYVSDAARGNGAKIYEAIWMGSTDERATSTNTKLTLTAKNNGYMRIDDIINGLSGYEVNIEGDTSGKVQLNNKIQAQASLSDYTAKDTKVTLSKITLGLGINNGSYDEFSTADVTTKDGKFDLIDGQVGKATLKSLTTNGDLLLALDAGLRSSMVDSLIAESYSVNGNLVIDAINIVTGSATDTASVLVTANDELKGKYKISEDFVKNMSGVEVYDNASYDDTTGVLTLEGKTTLATLNQRVKTLEKGGSVDLSNYYTKSETYSKDQINNIQSLNNYYRKNKKSEILNGFEEWKTGNKITNNFSKCHADNDNFATNNGDFVLKNDNFVAKNPSRLGAFAKCEKACSRLSERFPASLEKNSAFEQYSRSARGTFLFVSQTHKNVLDNFYKNNQCLKASNDNFVSVENKVA